MRYTSIEGMIIQDFFDKIGNLEIKPTFSSFGVHHHHMFRQMTKAVLDHYGPEDTLNIIGIYHENTAEGMHNCMRNYFKSVKTDSKFPPYDRNTALKIEDVNMFLSTTINPGEVIVTTFENIVMYPTHAELLDKERGVKGVWTLKKEDK